MFWEKGILAIAGPARSVPTDAGGQRSAAITILSTNDFHGRYYPISAGPADATSQASDLGVETPYEFGRAGRVGGFSWLAASVEKIRRERGGETVLLVHAGDTFSDDLLGNLTRGEAMIHLMKALEYDFMAFGNHDFDYGVERTRELSKIAVFPMRGANVLETGSGQPFLGKPFLVRKVSGVRATHSGMLGGLHRYGTFVKGEEIRQTEIKVNEAIERKMKSQGTIRPPETGKVQVVR